MNLAIRPGHLEATVTTITGARIVLEDRVVSGQLSIEDGLIRAIEATDTVADPLEGDGDVLIPGIVDIHTDHFEKHVFPRAHVRWDTLQAALAHDAQVIGAGITTVFDSLCVGAAGANLDRRSILKPMIEALEEATAAGMLRAEHLVHLRCEVIDPQTPQLLGEVIDRAIVRVASVMEHLPGTRQSKDIAAYVRRRMKDSGDSEATVMAEIAETLSVAGAISATVRPEVVALCRAHNLPLMSHDDTEPEHIALAVSENVAISEFPCTVEAARLARKAGMHIVAGAPNIMRGGSQSGNVAVSALLREGLVDSLASDYVPRSLLDAAFRIARDPHVGIGLPQSVAMVTRNPARAAGLMDRGTIAVGQRADLVQVGLHRDQPFVRAIWREGRRVL